MGFEGRRLCGWAGSALVLDAHVSCRVGLRKPVCAVTSAVCDDGVRRFRQDHIGELPAAVGSLLPPRDVRCSKIRFSLHLTCSRERQGQLSDPICTESCEFLF